MIYLDNNANTIVPETVCVEMLKWLNKGNPSASYASARSARKMMDDFRTQIGELCGINPCCGEERDGAPASQSKQPNRWRIIFTSGGSESNCMVVGGAIAGYSARMRAPPHIIASSVEHKSVLSMLEDYRDRGLISLSLVPIDIHGRIQPEEVRKLVRSNTALVCIMHANNETGTINDMAAIRKVVGAIPIHCDTVQTFGKYKIRPLELGINSFSVSCHKFNGPQGVGLLVIQQAFLNGYDIHPMIYGSQNYHMRGGTENLPGIGASRLAMLLAHTARSEKNAKMARQKAAVIAGLRKSGIPVMTYDEYLAPRAQLNEMEIVILSPAQGALPNTLLLSVVKHMAPMVCNVEMKNALESRGVIVSVGSACNTASPMASHVLFALGADDFIRKGALRISLGDETTDDEIARFLQVFVDVVVEQQKKKVARK